MSRLDSVVNWPEAARVAGYDPTALASQVKVTPRHLRRYFWAVFDKAPENLLGELRIWDATQLLCESLFSVKEVKGRLHFKSSSHFFRRFRQFHGCTPLEFVQIHVDRIEKERLHIAQLMSYPSGNEDQPPNRLTRPWISGVEVLFQKITPKSAIRRAYEN